MTAYIVKVRTNSFRLHGRKAGSSASLTLSPIDAASPISMPVMFRPDASGAPFMPAILSDAKTSAGVFIFQSEPDDVAHRHCSHDKQSAEDDQSITAQHQFMSGTIHSLPFSFPCRFSNTAG